MSIRLENVLDALLLQVVHVVVRPHDREYLGTLLTIPEAVHFGHVRGVLDALLGLLRSLQRLDVVVEVSRLIRLQRQLFLPGNVVVFLENAATRKPQRVSPKVILSVRVQHSHRQWQT